MTWYGFVQAGGGSTRFGTDKALAEIAGKTMLQRTGELLECVCDQVCIIAAAGKYDGTPWKVIEDGWPGEGPLGGILTALQHLKAQRMDSSGDHPHGQPHWAMILGCDLPFMNRDFLAFLKERALLSRAQVLAPESSSGLEPLCACWRADALWSVEQSFDAGVRKVTEAMKQVGTEVLDEAAWKRFDNGNRLFWNMNTPEDYREACRIETGTYE